MTVGPNPTYFAVASDVSDRMGVFADIQIYLDRLGAIQGKGDLVNRKTLENATDHTDLTALQKKLSEAGLYAGDDHHYYADGIYGPVTEHALKLSGYDSYANTHLSFVIQDHYLSTQDILMTQASLNATLPENEHVRVTGNLDADTAQALQQHIKEQVEALEKQGIDISSHVRHRLEQALENDGQDTAFQEMMKGILKNEASKSTQPSRESLEESRSIQDNFDDARGEEYSGVPDYAQGILDIIKTAESSHDYNVMNGGSEKYLQNGRDLTEMTIDEILAEQGRIDGIDGVETTAAGAYQIMPDTLRGLKEQMNLTGNETFTPALQDEMAYHLIMEKRDFGDFLDGNISTQQAMQNLSMEWAGLRDPFNGGKSYYDNVGSNSAHHSISLDDFEQIVHLAKQEALSEREIQLAENKAPLPEEKPEHLRNETIIAFN